MPHPDLASQTAGLFWVHLYEQTPSACLQGRVKELQHHAAIDKLLKASGGYQGNVSLAALQCQRTLAQGYCVQGNYIKAMTELEDALKCIEKQPNAAAMLAMKVGIMFELADIASFHHR